MRIALLGASNTGKTTVSKHLVKSHGYVHVSTGTIVRSISTILFDNETKNNLALVANTLNLIGENIVFDAAVRHIDLNHENIVFDAVRTSFEHKTLKLLGFVIVKISKFLDVKNPNMTEDRFETFHRTADHDILVRNDSDLTFLLNTIDELVRSNIK